MKMIALILPLFLILSACSVEEAIVQGDPPTTSSTFFKADALTGEFSLAKPGTVFLWPVVDEQGQPLSREQEVTMRSKVIVASETLDFIGGKIEELETQIGGLTQQFVTRQCGLFEADGLFDPDPQATEVDTWKEPDPKIPGEAQAVAQCQKNQATRGEIKKTYLKPLIEKAGEVSFNLLTVLGEENYFTGFDQLKISFSEEIKIAAVGFQGMSFDSQSEDPFMKVRNILFDRDRGLLQFSLPAYQQSEERLIYLGEYTFRLEINTNGSQVSMGGEIVFDNRFTGDTRLGRASFAGQVSTF